MLQLRPPHLAESSASRGVVKPWFSCVSSNRRWAALSELATVCVVGEIHFVTFSPVRSSVVVYA
jgi:hypothetical protein